MSNSLEKYLAEKRASKLLSLFLTAGYPNLRATVPLAQLVADAGADLIELGIPFSDPLADGPTIQEASAVALENGVTVPLVLEMAGEMRARLDIPVLLMGYFNPILQFGVERFIAAAQQAGVAGVIIPDLPVEESMPLRETAAACGISIVDLVSPNTPPHRLVVIDRFCSSFVYATSVIGVTGARQNVGDLAARFVAGLRQHLRHPILVGFGVSSADDARKISRHADGVIVGSALLQRIKRSFAKPDGNQEIARFVQELKAGLQEKRDGH